MGADAAMADRRRRRRGGRDLLDQGSHREDSNEEWDLVSEDEEETHMISHDKEVATMSPAGSVSDE